MIDVYCLGLLCYVVFFLLIVLVWSVTWYKFCHLSVCQLCLYFAVYFLCVLLICLYMYVCLFLSLPYMVNKDEYINSIGNVSVSRVVRDATTLSVSRAHHAADDQILPLITRPWISHFSHSAVQISFAFRRLIQSWRKTEKIATRNLEQRIEGIPTPAGLCSSRLPQSSCERTLLQFCTYGMLSRKSHEYAYAESRENSQKVRSGAENKKLSNLSQQKYTNSWNLVKCWTNVRLNQSERACKK